MTNDAHSALRVPKRCAFLKAPLGSTVAGMAAAMDVGTAPQGRNQPTYSEASPISSNPFPDYHGRHFFLGHEVSTFPYRFLVPKKVEGLVLSARCIFRTSIDSESELRL